MNGKPVGDASELVRTSAVPSQRLADVVTKAGFLGHRKCGADLHALGSGGERIAKALGRTDAACKPKRQAKRLQLLQIHHVAGAVDGLAALVELERAARRGVVAAGRWTLDHEPVDLAVRATGEALRKRVGCDDREKVRSLERWQIHVHVLARGERHQNRVVGARPGHRERVGRRLMVGELVEHPRDLHGDARAHEHVVHAGQHCPVDRGQMRHLDLLEEVDPDRVVVPLAGQGDFDEIRDHHERLPLERRRLRRHRDFFERLERRLATGDVVALPDVGGHLGDGEGVECPTHVAPGISRLQASCEHLVDRRSADHPELPVSRDGLREAPI